MTQLILGKSNLDLVTMPKGREIVVLKTDKTIIREIRDGSAVPVEDSSTITKVELVINKGSVRYSFNSTDNSAVVSKPDNSWLITLSLGAEDIEEGDYAATLILFDSVNDDGIPVQEFQVRVKSV